VIPGAALLQRLPVGPDELAGLALTVGALLPAAIFVTWAAEGRPGLTRLGRRVIRWRFGVGWWLVVLVGLPVLTLVSALVLGDTPQSIDPAELLVDQLQLLLINFLLVNLWEEAAWTGVVQTHLERRHGVFLAAVLTAVPFGFAHWPLAFLGDVTVTSALVSLGLFLVLGALVRPLFGLTLRGSRDSVLAVALMHSVFNRTNNADGISARLLAGDRYQLGVVVALVLLTTVLALVLRGRLGPAFRRRLDGIARPANDRPDRTDSALSPTRKGICHVHHVTIHRLDQGRPGCPARLRPRRRLRDAQASAGPDQ
jgi:membrane protease YdiL (CAAX protease family)